MQYPWFNSIWFTDEQAENVMKSELLKSWVKINQAVIIWSIKSVDSPVQQMWELISQYKKAGALNEKTLRKIVDTLTKQSVWSLKRGFRQWLANLEEEKEENPHYIDEKTYVWGRLDKLENNWLKDSHELQCPVAKSIFNILKSKFLPKEKPLEQLSNLERRRRQKKRKNGKKRR